MTNETNKTVTFQVVDHGIDGAQYFPGCGVSFTEFEHCVTGSGDTFAEAIDDALESMAQETSGVDFEALEKEIQAEGYGENGKWQKSRSAYAEMLKANGIADAENPPCKECGCVAEECECEAFADPLEDFQESDVYYYVSIRYSVADAA
jgi:hypothetical protein